MFRLVVELLVNLRYRQLLIRNNMELAYLWNCARESQDRRLVVGVLSLLRMAALMKYIIFYPGMVQSNRWLTSESKLFEKILKSNLNADDVLEADYILLFLGIKINFQTTEESLKACIPTVSQLKDILSNWTHKDSLIKFNTLVLQSRSTSFILDKYNKERVVTLRKITENFNDFYNSFLYMNCEKCGKSNKFAVCLLCGYVCCLRSCEKADEQDNNSSSVLN